MAKIIVNNPRQVINGGAKKYYFKVKGLGGPKGDKGDKGDTGATGPEGPQGNAATVSIGSTTTLPVGYDATVTNSGSIYNAVLNFGIPQGPRGPQGATGATGAKGDKGDQGNPGPQGEKGTNATVYVGTTSTLNPGSQATVYNSGTDSNAVLNFGIPKGEKGDTGPMPTIAQSTGQATDQVMSQKATTDALNTKQATITSSNKLSADLVDDTSTTNKFVTASDITNWNGKQDALTAGTGIDITSGIISTPAIVPEVVAELPTTGAEGKLYLTPKAHTTSTATGNPIEATITAQAGQLESFQLDGDTFQQSYTGKNLYNIEAIPYVWRRAYSPTGEELSWAGYVGTDAYQPVEPNTQYALWNNKPGNTTYLCEYDENKNFIQRLIAVTTFTTTATTKYLRWSLSVGDGEIPPTQTQLELGSKTSYEPFVGGQPSPSPDYPQQIQTVTGRQVVKVEGKNLLNLADKTVTERGVLINMSNGNVLSLDGTATSTGDSFYYYSANIKITQDSVLSGNVLGGTAVDGALLGLKLRIQRSDGTGYWASIKVGEQMQLKEGLTIAQFYLGLTSGTVFTNYKVGIQLEKGSTASAYTPYSLTDYPISLRENKVLDMSQATRLDAYINGSGVIVSSGGDALFSIQVEPNATYTLTKTVSSRFRYVCTSTTPAVGANVGVTTNTDSATSATVTTGANDTYIVCVYWSSASTSTKDEIFNSIGITGVKPIELCKLGSYQDYIWKDGEDWKVHKAVEKLRLVSSQGWAKSSTMTTLDRYFIRDYFPSGTIPSDMSAVVVQSNYFTAISQSASDSRAYGICQLNGSGMMINTVLGTFASNDAFKNWLDSNSVNAYYAIATATDTTITDTTLIAQLEAIRTASLQNGTNTITNTATGTNLAGDMEIGYYGFNPTNRYDKFIWLDLNNNYEQIGGE